MPTGRPTNPDLSLEVAALKRQVAQLLRLLGQVDAGGRALSISQFCARNNISRNFFYKLKMRRKAPRIMDVDYHKGAAHLKIRYGKLVGGQTIGELRSCIIQRGSATTLSNTESSAETRSFPERMKKNFNL